VRFAEARSDAQALVALAQTGERLVVERPDLGLACGRSVIGFGRRAPPSREADTPLVSQAPAPVSNQGEATDHGELRRISLPRTRVNKGMEKGRGCSTPRPSPLLASVLGVPALS
jgi:hypothetical protein